MSPPPCTAWRSVWSRGDVGKEMRCQRRLRRFDLQRIRVFACSLGCAEKPRVLNMRGRVLVLGAQSFHGFGEQQVDVYVDVN